MQGAARVDGPAHAAGDDRRPRRGAGLPGSAEGVAADAHRDEPLVRAGNEYERRPVGQSAEGAVADALAEQLAAGPAEVSGRDDQPQALLADYEHAVAAEQRGANGAEVGVGLVQLRRVGRPVEVGLLELRREPDHAVPVVEAAGLVAVTGDHEQIPAAVDRRARRGPNATLAM